MADKAFDGSGRNRVRTVAAPAGVRSEDGRRPPRTVTEEQMDQNDTRRGSGQAPAKDFLALTHGQEWVNFYESFDKLVQDHLSRSSELLRRAMSLPEVADREVAQVRAEMEGKLAAERERSRDLLVALRNEIDASHHSVASLADGVQGVVTDLESLSARVAEALTSLEGPAPSTPALQGGEAAQPVAAADGVADEPVAEPSFESTADDTVIAEAAPAIESEAPVEAVSEETPAAEADPVAEPMSASTEESDTDQSVAGEMPSEPAADPATSLDLNAMAAAEDTARFDGEVPFAADAPSSNGEPAPVGGDRPRPHWLSVTRIGSRP
jgi:hypothetical protein